LSNILFFIDLDDTIFQTKRKNLKGIIPATFPENPENISYMTNSQKLFIDSFLKMDNVRIIPVTARDRKQYHRTFISKEVRVRDVAMYFAAVITENGEIDQKWESHIDSLYKKLKFPLDKIFALINKNIDPEIFKISLVEDFYLVIKNRLKGTSYIEQNESLLPMLKNFLEDEYFIHYNDNNIALLPNFIDKKFAVEYFVDKYKPELTIGAGDSLTDLSFMHSCDFKVIPKHSQIAKTLLNQNLSSFQKTGFEI
jgi:hypothetical protein